MEHWLRRCPRIYAMRQTMFGSPFPPIKVLNTAPERVLAISRATIQYAFGPKASATIIIIFVIIANTLCIASNETFFFKLKTRCMRFM